MRYALLVQGGPYSSQASHSALRFADALLARMGLATHVTHISEEA